MKNYRNWVLWSVWATVLVAASAEPLLKNGAFQEGDDGWELPEPYRLENASGRNGTVSLSYERTSPDEYPLTSQDVQLEPGKRYRFSAWVKTEGVENGKATVCL
ncbi:MAG: carbohydrate binding domain-containing protein, partial [Methylococcales bacterium]|nr:carbohydrate binding domain-containing protein [Methylococcales bacterium]